ncbi:uncharacterized protein PAE49_003411 isoform 2-T2 [Odontesthes bonariensis]
MAARLLFVIFMCCLHEIQARGQKPELIVNPGEADVIFVCLLPGSVKHDTTCNLYFGEERSPVRTLTARESRNSKKYPWICQFFLPVDDILKRVLLVQQKDASCDYSLENKLNSLSPRSDPRSLADYVKGVSNSAVTMRTAKSTVSKFSFFTPTASVNLKPVSHRPQNTDTLTTVSTTDYVKGVSNSAVTMRTAKSTVSKFSFFTPTASVNLKPVSHRPQNTDTLTTVSTTDAVETEVTTTPTMPAFTVSTVIRITAVVTLVLLGSALLVCQSRTENCFCKRPMANISDEMTEMSENIRSSEPQQAESALRDLMEAAVAQGERP